MVTYISRGIKQAVHERVLGYIACGYGIMSEQPVFAVRCNVVKQYLYISRVKRRLGVDAMEEKGDGQQQA